MRVAIDSGPLTSGHKVRGIGAMTEELIKALGKNVEAVDFQKADLNQYDLVHYSSFDPYFLTLPQVKPTKKVIVTIHDLIPLIYPRQYPTGIKGKLRFWEQKKRLKNVDAIITISETSKKDIVRFLEVDPEKIHVIYLGMKAGSRPLKNQSLRPVVKKYQLPEKFVFYVGDVNYNKNVLNLVKACRLAGLPLIIAGKQALEVFEEGLDLKIMQGPRDYWRYLFGKAHPQISHLKELRNEFRKNKVKCLGFVSDEDLIALYNLAQVYVQPSLYEGFGLPVLQAMACGTPVIINQTNALVEVAGGAAEIVDATNPEKLAAKIKKVVQSQKKAMQKAGLKRAKEFSWKKCAHETIAVYKKVFQS